MSADENEDRRDEGLPDSGHHLSDEEIERAMAGFEAEFSKDQNQGSRDSDEDSGDGARHDSAMHPDGAANSDSAIHPGSAAHPDPAVHSEAAMHPESDDDPVSVLKGADGVSSDFDQELEGLIGNRAKAAVMVTRLASAELLAAFCQLSDISAWCIQAREGAVAVLRNLDGDGPEAAIRDLTTVVSGLSAILAVNRADKLEVTLWINGQSGQTFAPPMLFASTADFVEDLMIGTTTVDRLREDGATMFDSGDYNREKAMGIIAAHTRFGAGGSARKGRVE